MQLGTFIFVVVKVCVNILLLSISFITFITEKSNFQQAFSMKMTRKTLLMADPPSHKISVFQENWRMSRLQTNFMELNPS
jgi:hypothetical protein